MSLSWIPGAIKVIRILFSKQPRYAKMREEMQEGGRQLSEGVKEEVCEPFKAGLEDRPHQATGKVGPIGQAMRNFAVMAAILIIVAVLIASGLDSHDEKIVRINQKQQEFEAEVSQRKWDHRPQVCKDMFKDDDFKHFMENTAPGSLTDRARYERYPECWPMNIKEEPK